MTNEEIEYLKDIEEKERHINKLEAKIRDLEQRPTGQNTTRTLIDCMNHYLQSCEPDCKIDISMQNRRFNLSLSRNGAHVYLVEGARNMQCAYEEMTEFLLLKAFGIDSANEVKK